MADRTVAVRLRAVVGDYVAGMARAGASTRALGAEVNKAGKEHPKNLERVGKASLLLGGAVAAGFGLAIRSTLDFDRQMSAVGAAAQANSKDLAALRDAALQAGKDTSFSATEAAEAEEALAKAGISTSDILNGALTGSLNLAAAGQMDLGEAAEDAASAMTTFGLRGKDVGHIADVLAAGAGKAQGEVSDLSLALKQSGLVAAQMGVSLDDTVGALAEFAANGLLGSDAGTSFKTMLLALNPQSEQAAGVMHKLGLRFFDARGQFIGVAALAGELHDKLGSLSQEEQNMALKTIFGNDAIRAANILMRDGADGSKKWAQAVNDQGFAAEVAAKKTDNLAGDLERLKGSIETALIENGSAATGVLRGLTQHLDAVVTGFSDLPKPLQETAIAFGGVTGAVAGTLGVVGTVAPKVREARESLRSLGKVGTTVDKGLGLFGRAIGASLPLLGAGVIALDIWSRHKADAAQAVKDFTQAVEDDNGAIGENTRKLAANKLEQSGALAAAEKLGIRLSDVTDAALGNHDALDRVNATMDQYSLAIGRAQGPNRGLTRQQHDQLNAVTDLDKALKTVAPEIQQGADAARRKAEAESEAGSSTQDHATATDHATSALQEEVSAVDALKAALDALNGRNISAEQAAIAYEAAVDASTQSIKDNGSTLDIHTAKGRANMTALLDQAQAAQAYAEAVVDQTGDQDKANQILGKARSQLLQVAMQSGLTRQQAQRLVDTYLRIPKDKSTTIHTNADAARAAVDRLNNSLNTLHDRTVSVNVRTIYSNPGTAVTPSGGRPALADGGLISGSGGPRSDTVPIMASPGEFMVTADAVSRPGVLKFLTALNAGKVRRLADGGLIRPAYTTAHAMPAGLSDQDVARLAAAITRAPGTQNVHVTGEFRARGRDLVAVVQDTQARARMR